MNVRKEIDAYAHPDNRPVLHWLFDRYHRESQWHQMAVCCFHRYGPLSYEAHRVWVPTDLGLSVYHADRMKNLLGIYAEDQACGGPARELLLKMSSLPAPVPPPEWSYDREQKKYIKL